MKYRVKFCFNTFARPMSTKEDYNNLNDALNVASRIRGRSIYSKKWETWVVELGEDGSETNTIHNL